MAFILAAESILYRDRTPNRIDSIVWSVGGTINNWPTNVKHKAQVVLMPFAGKGPCQSYLQSAVNLAVGAAFNTMLVAAAGNNASDS
jgi:hypothetical protein